MISPSDARRVRFAHAAAALLTIGAGLTAHFAGSSLGPSLRDALGDALWAAMMMWLIGAFAPRAHLFARSAVAYAICACVETSQLYHATTLDAARQTTVGHLVLGSGFDPRDFLWYALGIAGAAVLELTARGTTRSSRDSSHPQS